MGRPFLYCSVFHVGLLGLRHITVALDVPPDVGGHCVFRGYKAFQWDVLQQTESGNVNRYGGC